MVTTIKVSEETKERLLSLDLADKGKSFDMVVNDLITSYQNVNKKYSKDYKIWKKSLKVHKKEIEEYQKRVKQFKNEEEIWNKLLKWAKSKGFKP